MQKINVVAQNVEELHGGAISTSSKEVYKVTPQVKVKSEDNLHLSIGSRIPSVPVSDRPPAGYMPL